jgi:hypothetical protein
MANIKLQDISQCSQNEAIHFLKNIQATPNPLPYILPRKEFTMGIWGWRRADGYTYPLVTWPRDDGGRRVQNFLPNLPFGLSQ